MGADNYFSENPNPHIKLAPKVAVQDVKHLDTFFQEVLDLGGEGIILRDPKSPYVPGRSPGYLKYKVRRLSPNPKIRSNLQIFCSPQKYRDAEAKVVGPSGN